MYEFIGDVNNDGKITVLDALLATQILAGSYVDEEATNRADIDSSGDVSIDDVTMILKHLKGEIIISGVVL